MWIPSFGNNSTHFLKGWSLASRAVWWRHLSCLPAEGTQKPLSNGPAGPWVFLQAALIYWPVVPRDQDQELRHLRPRKLFTHPAPVSPAAVLGVLGLVSLPQPCFPTCSMGNPGQWTGAGVQGLGLPHRSVALLPFPVRNFSPLLRPSPSFWPGPGHVHNIESPGHRELRWDGAELGPALGPMLGQREEGGC